jgi:magnesium transporter
MSTSEAHEKIEEHEIEEVSPEMLEGEHPADVADAIEAMPHEEGADVLEALDPEDAARALSEMDVEDAHSFVEEMGPPFAAQAFEHMALDDAADLLTELPDELSQQIMAALPEGQRAELVDLMTYPPESAGGIMSPEVIALSANLSIPEAIAELRRIADETEQIYYTYVVDHQHRLVGVLSLRDLLLASPGKKLHDIMITRITSVPATMDREEVAAMLSKYGYLALPVVEEDGRLLGIVTVDDVVEVLQQEATEDMQVMVGAGADERIDSPLHLTLARRLPWLFVNLVTAFLAAAVVGLFESTIEKLTWLAVLMPVVAGQAGNTGAQSMAVVIRGIATGETRGLEVRRLLLRNTAVGLLTGLAIGLVAGTVSFFWWSDASISIVLGVAMLACMAIAAVSGAFVPWIMQRLGFDPAQSSSIILTTITDVTGFGIFLALGAVVILWEGG